jgi:hypothetical protein
MALWGISTSDEAKPKYLTADQKKNTYATDSGWVYKDPNTGLEEVLVAIGGLTGGTTTNTRLGAADITALTWVTSALDDGDTAITVDVVYNEKVDVDTTGGTPSMVVSNDDTSGDANGDYTLSYASGTGTNKLRFTATGLTLSATDVLSIGAQNIALNSGTMKDAGQTTVNAKVAISAAVGTAAGDITVTAA